MKKLLLLLCAAAALFATPATVLVTQTLWKADGTPYHGTIYISWQQFDTGAGEHIPAGTKQVNLSATGLLSVNLVPNIGASPSGTHYTTTYKLDLGSSQTVSWVVPASGPVTVTAIESTILVGPTSILSLGQLASGGATNNQLLAWSTSAVAWVPVTDITIGNLSLTAALTDNSGSNAFSLSAVGAGLKFRSDNGIRWSNSASTYSATLDTGIDRAAAGVLEVNNGTVGTPAAIKVTTAQTVSTTVGSLPTCNSGATGMRSFVTDSNAASFTAGIGAIVAAGGSTKVPVTCDGTNWRIG